VAQAKPRSCYPSWLGPFCASPLSLLIPSQVICSYQVTSSAILNSRALNMGWIIFQKTEFTSEYVNVELVESRRRMLQLIAHPKYEGAEILDESLSIVNIQNVTSSMEYTILMGVKILETSKLSLYRALDRMQDTFPGLKLCGENTDGLSLLVPDPTNSLTYLATMNHLFDFSNLQVSNKFMPYNRLNAGNARTLLSTLSNLFFCRRKVIIRTDVESSPDDPVGVHVFAGVPKSVSALYTHSLYRKLHKDLVQLVNWTIKKSFSTQATK
jgi:hypothetical protein